MEDENNDIVYGELDDKKEQEQNQDGEQKPEVKKKKKMDLFRYKPETLTDPNSGLVFLYEKIKDELKPNSNFNEVTELDRYIKLIKEWHYYLVPKFDYEFFLDRTQRLGTQAIVKNQLQQMRKAHKGIIPWDYIKQSLNDEGVGIDLGVNTLQEQAITLTETQQKPIQTLDTLASIQTDHIYASQGSQVVSQQENYAQSSRAFVPPSNRKKIVVLKSQNTQKSVTFSLDSGVKQSEQFSFHSEVKQSDQIGRQSQTFTESKEVDEDFDLMFEQIGKIENKKKEKLEIFETQ